jgi:hypothetical protein
MGAESREVSEFSNYFNYFTEIEEHFQRARGTSLFLLSPLDWALIETWKNSDVPLEAVLRGIDSAFEKWRAKRSKTQAVNSLAFCSQAVLTEAQRNPGTAKAVESSDPFSRAEVEAFLQANVNALREKAGYEEIAKSLEELLHQLPGELEQLEERLSVLEQKLVAIARTKQSEELALEAKREMDAHLAPYRRKMGAAQISMLERQFLERKLLDQEQLPRLSLFYLKSG